MKKVFLWILVVLVIWIFGLMVWLSTRDKTKPEPIFEEEKITKKPIKPKVVKEVIEQPAQRDFKPRQTRLSALISSLSFFDIRNNMKDMTQAQWKTYARSLEGKTVEWEGWVEEVKEKFFGGYEIWVDMDSPEEAMSVQDVTFDIPEDLAMKFNKNQLVAFRGTIKSVMNVLGSCQVDLENASLQQLDLTPRNRKMAYTLSQNGKPSRDKPIGLEILTIKPYGSDYTSVQVKLVNLSYRHINRCELVCILKDANGRHLGFEKNYVISSLDGGLAPGAATYHEFLIHVNRALVHKVLFDIQGFDW